MLSLDLSLSKFPVLLFSAVSLLESTVFTTPRQFELGRKGNNIFSSHFRICSFSNFLSVFCYFSFGFPIEHFQYIWQLGRPSVAMFSCKNLCFFVTKIMRYNRRWNLQCPVEKDIDSVAVDQIINVSLLSRTLFDRWPCN